MVTLTTKKRLMYLVFSLAFLCTGVEYAVIIPTLWLYLHGEYDVPEYTLGLALSLYSLAAAFSSPIVGRLVDVNRKSKPIFIVLIIIQIVGSFLYFADISAFMALTSRFISGLGNGMGPIALAEVARYTSEEERTPIISKLIAIRQVALLIGPGFNVFLKDADFKIGPFKVNSFTSPGLFMVGIWICLLVVVITVYYEPVEIYENKIVSDNESNTVEDNQIHSNMIEHQAGEDTSNNKDVVTSGSSLTNEEDINKLLPSDNKVTAAERPTSSAQTPETGREFLLNEYLRDSVVSVLYVLFCSMFSQVSLEAMLTPLSLKYLDFSELDNSLMFCLCGVEVILIFLLLTRLSRVFSDRSLIVAGSLVSLVSNTYLVCYIPTAHTHDRGGNLPYFTLGTLLDLVSIPVMFVCATSLFSKITRRETQGLSQGVRRAVMCLANILGPLWGSSTVNQPYLLFAVLIGQQVLAAILFLGSFTKFKREIIKDKEIVCTSDDSERECTSVRSDGIQGEINYGTIQKS